MKFEVLNPDEMPDPDRGKWVDVVAALSQGKAVRLELSDRDAQLARMAIGQAAGRRGIAVRSSYRDGYLYVGPK